MKRIKNKIKSTKKLLFSTSLILVANTNIVLGADGTEKIDQVVKDFMVPWIERIGVVIAIFGAVALADSYFNDNPASKSMGTKLLAGGLMLRFGMSFFVNLVI